MKKITLGEFIPMLSEMATVWPGISATARGKLYYSAIADLEADIVKGLCDHFMSTFHKMPLPSDFVEVSRLWKRDYFEKTGRYYGDPKKEDKPQPFKPECTYCFDSGYEWIAIDSNSVFCFCFCKAGDVQHRDSSWNLPRSSELIGIQRKNFPAKAFMPRESVESLAANIEQLDPVKRWKDAVAESQEFWKHYFERKKA